MLVFLLAGLSFGFASGFSPGPLFALVISQTVRYGLKEGVKTALAPLITDLPIVAAATFLLSRISAYNSLLGWISFAGGIFLIFMAWETLKIKGCTPEIDVSGAKSFLRGALVNALSPHPYLFWIMVGSPTLLTAYSHSLSSAMGFIAGFYLALVGAKIILAAIVNRSRNFMNGKIYIYTMRFLGLLLLLFAVLLFRDGINML